jgi:iron-sulfur cluster assembly accessory protein
VFIVTDKAAEKAKLILAAEGKDTWGIRIFNAGNSCCGPSYGLDLEEMPNTDDEITEKNGVKIFIGKNIAASLLGMQLDYHQDGDHEGFVLTGGCGPSCASGASGCSTC